MCSGYDQGHHLHTPVHLCCRSPQHRDRHIKCGTTGWWPGFACFPPFPNVLGGSLIVGGGGSGGSRGSQRVRNSVCAQSVSKILVNFLQ